MSGARAQARAAPELSPAERQELLRIARGAIEAHFAGRPAPLSSAAALGEGSGAFVTLRRRDDHELRGCIGQLESDAPLAETVAAVAVAAASRDTRFTPVRAGELGSLQIEISVLSPFAPIRPADVVVGRHGLVAQLGSQRGLLLPQVPVEHGWDREAFLGHTCEKAGLPRDSWRQPGLELLGFTATVFAEDA